MIDPYEQLSPAGLRRREAILQATLAAVRRRRRRRRQMPVLGGTVLVILGALWLGWPRTGPGAPEVPGTTPGLAPTRMDAPPDSPPTSPTLVVVIPADSTASSRLAAQSQPPTWQVIDDEALLAAVTETGRRAGLARIDGQTLLLVR